MERLESSSTGLLRADQLWRYITDVKDNTIREVSFDEPEASARAIVTHPGRGPLRPQPGSVEVPPSSPAVRATKAADKGHGLVLRVYNMADHDVSAEIRLYDPLSKATLANPNEQEQEEPVVNRRRKVSLPVRGNEIVTQRFQL